MRRACILLLIFFLCSAIYGQTSLKNVINNGDLSGLDRIIEKNDELWNLSQSELHILRNTIYAKYRYIFKSTDLQNHFLQFSWYRAEHENVDDQLSIIDKENITRIQSWEKSLADMIAFQNKTLSWIQSENISLPSELINIDGISLYQNPTLSLKTPERLTVKVEWDDGTFIDFTTAFCFGMGRFLNQTEIGQFDLKDFSIVFNPSILFLSDSVFGRVYKPFNDNESFLIAVEYASPAVENIQSNQIKNDSAKNILILSWSVTYSVYKISANGEIELIDRVVAN